MWLQLKIRCLISLQQPYRIFGTNKNTLHPPWSILPLPKNILPLSPTLIHNAPSLTKAAQEYNQPPTITKSDPKPPLWNLLIMASPSRDPTSSTGTKANLRIMKINSAFDILTSIFHHKIADRTTHVLRYILAPATKNISGNIYQYHPRHCANGGPQVKAIYFDQSYLPLLTAPTLRLIVAITAVYHLNIGIADVTNAFRNTLKDSSERDIIDFPPHYISWFKLIWSSIRIEPAPNDCYVMEIFHRMQGIKPAGRQRNTILNLILPSLGFVKHVIDNDIYILWKNSPMIF